MIPAGTEVVIFTDLDGTLLDSVDYSFLPAVPALRAIKERRIPLVFCSSKTSAEIEYYRRKLQNGDPFISENGGGVFVPKGYFRFRLADQGLDPQAYTFSVDEDDTYEIIRLGAKYRELRKALARLREMGFSIKGFGDMSADEISGMTGLSLQEARMARQRAFDEPFVIRGDRTRAAGITKAIEALGLRHSLGRLNHLTGPSDKGKAVSLLAALYRHSGGDIITVGIGDAPNDLPMLRVVDYPMIVQQSDGSYREGMDIPGLTRVRGKGPEGWNTAVLKLLEHYQ